MIKGLRELANYWEADTEESRQIIEAITEIERYQEIERRLNEEIIRRTYLTSDKQLFDVVGKVSLIISGGDAE